jgi:alkylhydroperoxidase family enzyme
MSYISTPKADDSFYDANRDPAGYIPNFVQLFSGRPEIYAAWRQLNGAIRSSMDLRRYELATLGAATALKSSYCCLAHGKVLADKFYTSEEVVALAQEPANDPVDRAIIEFARKVALSADSISQSDVDELKAVGLSDDDVFGVVLAAAARCFFSKTLDSTGTPPDSAYNSLPENLRVALTVGRPIDHSG